MTNKKTFNLYRTILATIWAAAWLVSGLWFASIIIQQNAVPTSSLNGTIAFAIGFIGMLVSFAMAAAGAEDIVKEKKSQTSYEELITYMGGFCLVIVLAVIYIVSL